MSQTNFLHITTAIILVFSLVSCGSGKPSESESGEAEMLADDIVELRADQQTLAKVDTGSIEMRWISSTLKVNGIVTVVPQNYATVCMPMGGFIKSTSMIPGNAVKKGEVLAVIENQDFIDVQQNYLQAKNKFEFAEAEYNRHSQLYNDKVYSEQNLQEVTTNYKNLKAEVKALEQKLALIGINPVTLREEDISRSVPVTSPISGYVKTVNVNVGKYVTPTDVLFEVVNSNQLLLELTLFDKDADKVAVGQNIRFFINNESDVHDAVICQTGKSIGDDKSYKVYASVPVNCKNVIPGMYVNAVIETSGNLVTSLPSEAIVSFDDKEYIFIFEKEKEEDGKPFTEYRMVQIRKGISNNGFTQIFLPENIDTKTCKIVVKGAYNLLSAKKNAGEMAC